MLQPIYNIFHAFHSCVAKSLDRNGIANGGGVTGKNGATQKPKVTLETESYGSSVGGAVTCHKCGKQFGKWENLEAHHLSKHAGNFLMIFCYNCVCDYFILIEIVICK